MDFFSAQDSAHSKTKLLIVYFILAVIAIIGSTYLAAVLIFSYFGPQETKTVVIHWWQPETLVWVVVGTIAVVSISSIYKTMALRSGGGAVAESLGGQKVSSSTTDPDERKLLNVVTEMSIASGVPMPEVYVLPGEAGINAFAAGHSIDDAAVAVTRGCITQLSRDELQGVIAHEFSHILNGDMRINIRLMGTLFGILVITILGRILLRSIYFSGGSRRRDNRDNSALALFFFGLALIIIGYIGVFFGRLIQSAVSRQREFLADASAVQFTRNPDGISGALKKIGKLAEGSTVQHAHAEDAAHFFFACGIKGGVSALGGAFATHPPLDRRIKAIDTNWDGDFSKIADASNDASTKTPEKTKTSKAAVDPQAWIESIGVIGGAQLTQAQVFREKMEATFSDSLQTPLEARALILALLLSEDETHRAKQIAYLGQESDEKLSARVLKLYAKAKKLGPAYRLPLFDQVRPHLASLDASEYQTFIGRVEHLVDMDGKISVFEFVIVRLIKKYLGRRFEAPSTKTPPIFDLNKLEPSFARLLSLVVHLSRSDPGVAADDFKTALKKAPLFNSSLSLLDNKSIDFSAIDDALDVLCTAKFLIKKQVIAACVAAAAVDGKFSIEESEVLRAIASSLDCPLPPLAG